MRDSRTIYFYGNEAAAKRFLKACEMYHENNIKDVHAISYGMEEKNDIYRIFPDLAEAGGLDKNAVKQAPEALEQHCQAAVRTWKNGAAHYTDCRDTKHTQCSD